jgi:predicted secreted Zn-dependent protease
MEWTFTLVSVEDLTRTWSSHNPLLLDQGEQAHGGNKGRFSFELSWLRQYGFLEVMVAAIWKYVKTRFNILEAFLGAW